MFVRKDFPQKLGVSIVVLAGLAFLVLAANPHRFYVGVWILVFATGVDAVLYVVVPRITVCYRCRSEFREAPINSKHEGFELSTAEKYRA